MKKTTKDLHITFKEHTITNKVKCGQTHLIDIGVIPDGFWSDEKEKKYGKLFRKFAKVLTKVQIETIEQWEKNGRPI